MTRLSPEKKQNTLKNSVSRLKQAKTEKVNQKLTPTNYKFDKLSNDANSGIIEENSLNGSQSNEEEDDENDEDDEEDEEEVDSYGGEIENSSRRASNISKKV